MRFPNHVSCSMDLATMHDWVPVIPCMHPYCGAASSYAPVPSMGHLEFAAPTFWPPGFVTGKNKLTSNVRHRGQSFAQEGHDLGMALSHLSIPPDNALLAVVFLTSKRKAMFSAGEVKAEGKPVGCMTMYDLAVVPTPMMVCSVPSLPMAGTGMSVALSDLIVGMHWVDLVAGIVDTVVSFALEAIKAPKAPDWASNSQSQSLTSWGKDQFTSTDGATDSLRDSSPGIVAGLIRLAGQEWFGYRGDATVTVAVAGGAVGLEGGYSRSGEDGRSTVAIDGRLGPSDLANAHGHGEVSWGGTGGQGVGAAGNAGVGVLGSSADLGASTDRPTDHQGGFYGNLSTPFGGGNASLGEGWAGPTEGVPEL